MASRKRYAIQVRNGDGSLVETIRVPVRVEAIGNFAPLFCTYPGVKTRCLVQSDELHLDEPMRCDADEHVGKLFILPRDRNGKLVPTWADINKET
jgi:sugar lactone lactonase YvrE